MTTPPTIADLADDIREGLRSSIFDGGSERRDRDDALVALAALRARAEAAEAALATARADGAAALLSDILALLDKSAAHDRAEARRLSGDDRDALDTRATVTELIATSLAAHFGGPVEGA